MVKIEGEGRLGHLLSTPDLVNVWYSGRRCGEAFMHKCAKHRQIDNQRAIMQTLCSIQIGTLQTVQPSTSLTACSPAMTSKCQHLSHLLIGGLAR